MECPRFFHGNATFHTTQARPRSDDAEDVNNWITLANKYYRAYQTHGVQICKSYQNDVAKEDQTEFECLKHTNIGKAIQWYLRTAAELHDNDADEKISRLLKDLSNKLSDDQVAESERNTVLQIFVWLSEQGLRPNVRAQSRYILGEAYFHGWFVEKDRQTACKYYQQVKEFFPQVIPKIGRIHEFYGEIGLAFECYLTAYKHYQIAEAEDLMLDLVYEQGEQLLSGNKKESAAAFNFLTMAEKNVWKSAKAHLTNCLGNAYLWGVGGNKINYHEAFRWYTLAAERGSGPAMNNLGYMYEQNNWVNKNDKDAMIWYSKSAQSGCVEGMYNFAMRYAEGSIVEKDLLVALTWYLEAVKHGDGGAKDQVFAILTQASRCLSKPGESFKNKQAAFQLCVFAYETSSAMIEDQSAEDPDIAQAIAKQSRSLMSRAQDNGWDVTRDQQMATNNHQPTDQLGREDNENNLMPSSPFPMDVDSSN